jgi:flagellar hook-basal body complex protein FliE
MKITATSPNLIIPQGAQGLEGPPPKEDFGRMLNNMVGEVSKLQQDSDKKIAATLEGKEDLHEAMIALEKAGLGFKLLLQVRNKMVQAYEELSKMPL